MASAIHSGARPVMRDDRALRFSPIHPVTKGTSDSQNSRWRFAQSIRPSMRRLTSHV
jgi:hypothetical protein